MTSPALRRASAADSEEGVDRAGGFFAGLGDGLAGLADDQLSEGLGAPLDEAGGAFQDCGPGGAG